MKAKKLYIILPAMALMAVISCSRKPQKEDRSAEEIIPVSVIALQEGAAGKTVSASGLFTTDDETLLSFKTGGVISRVFVNQGDRVRKGQLLASLNLTEVDAGAAQARLGKEKAERDYQRAYTLYRDSVATLEQLQNARTALDLASQQFKSASFNRNYSEIRAPKDGYVLQRLANDGQVVGPGTPVLQVNGAGGVSWQIKVGVSDRQWAQIKPGDAANVETDVLPGQSLPAKVFKKAEGVDPASGTFTVFLKLENPAPSARFASGMFARTTIYPSADKNASWSVPYDAVLDGDAGEGYVFVTDDGKVARRQKVSIASISRSEVLVSGGLENARYLIVSGSPYLDNGSKITIRSKK